MLSNKSLALALCLTITGCAQTPQNDAEGGHWWSFGSDKAATKDAVSQADTKPDAKPAVAAKAPAPVAPAAAAPAPVAKADTGSSWWPFSSKADDAKADLKADLKAATPASGAPADAPAAAPAVAKTDTDTKWWWPFESKPKPLAKVDVANIPMPDPKITQAWLDDYEPRLRLAIKDSNLQLERRDNVLVVIAPVDGSYNPKRPAMLLPVTLGPFTRVAKAVEGDPKTAVLVLGHVDTSGAEPVSQALTKERAQSIASIFSLSGLKQDRLMLRGMGDLMPRAANDSNQGRALNRRMEIMFTQRTTMLALLSKYNSANPPKAEMVAVQDVPAPAAAPVKKAAAPAKKTVAKKAAAKPAAKKAPAKPAAKKPAPAKAAAPAATNDQAKN
ncbi:OmpA family protein [Pseudomonas sp. D8002]|jgi:outer membrane protein OmpA-like peptidoglycan-associated protein|uniref:OmpA family protein n=1 Tax=unclassified Pseudomonas TaxID=196821 RepID=UPI0015A0C428|nr:MULTISPECIES: OmpA family protein [unclassified Pseudomonas]NVZ30636.1 OmpA family protein [Pseudomonas sp. A4002]NWA90248.1 OmpA family protein [Pseudomonas sp. D8002]NWB10134.1 OmpA family protein [Pseudomonas sp. D5002]NWB44707.1 OmpA family protein [Pseudomonas sp. E6002]NWB56564.1 OmpA family protein [Pseudomonas sp. F8002]